MSAKEESDPLIWLEDRHGEKALDWVKARNAETQSWAKGPRFDSLVGKLRAILDSKDKIPIIKKRGKFFYNFWQDADHVKGLVRRTTLESYKQELPEWETVLDLDELSRKDGKDWVYSKINYLEPKCERAIISLSIGGSDAAVLREFDLKENAFVKGGFEIALSKSKVSWIDKDTLFVDSALTEEEETTSGYARVVKRWKRGQDLASAPIIFQVEKSDVFAVSEHYPNPGFERDFVHRGINFWESEKYLLTSGDKLEKVQIPLDSAFQLNREWMSIHLRSDWEVEGKVYKSGSLLGTKFDDFMKGERDLHIIFEPTPTTSLEDYIWTRNLLFLTILDDVKQRIDVVQPGSGAWSAKPFEGASFLQTDLKPVDRLESDELFSESAGFLRPKTFSFGTASPLDKLKSSPAFFDSSNMTVEQHFVDSLDGTKIPYFQIGPRNQSKTVPTILYGYGGFVNSELPWYLTLIGPSWLEKGYTFVVANIRGGGEYGPAWHQAGLKEKRHKVYEDFAAVAEDLVRRKVTTKSQLGAFGASNGGLLMGNMISTYPHLFRAISCEVPLLDMLRYHKLPAGASWIGEYGDPEKEEDRKFLQRYSAYHNIDDQKQYPSVLFISSTADDRVHPGHARKTMEKMRSFGADVSYYERIEGGHSGAADNEQAAYKAALRFWFFEKYLCS